MTSALTRISAWPLLGNLRLVLHFELFLQVLLVDQWAIDLHLAQRRNFFLGPFFLESFLYKIFLKPRLVLLKNILNFWILVKPGKSLAKGLHLAVV